MMNISIRHFVLKLLLLLPLFNGVSCLDDGTGYFWQITDIHYDANYSEHGSARYMCHQHIFASKMEIDFSVPDTGKHGRYGDYSCDSPWDLMKSAVHAMKSLKPDVDFVLWTGDNVPHVPDSEIDERKLLTVIKEVSDLLLETFPYTPFYPTIGNHDSWPANQVPISDQETYYSQLADYAGWHSMLGDDNLKTFRKGGYYSSRSKHGLWQIGLNTILWYSYNSHVGNLSDPADQFQWLETELESIRQLEERALLSGHVPPGYEPKGEAIYWYYPHFNRRFLNIVQQYADVIVALIFGHEHKDNVHIVLDKTDKPQLPLFTAPAVNPINSSAPGVGANNPGIRLYSYSRNTGEILDFTQFYLNLSAANMHQRADWLEEYTIRQTYGIDDITANSLLSLVDTFSQNSSDKFDKYYTYSSVSVDLDATCTGKCKRHHICGILYIDYDKFELCRRDEKRFGTVLDSVEPSEGVDTTDEGNGNLDHKKHYWHPHSHLYEYHSVSACMYWFIWGLVMAVVVLFIVTVLVSRWRRMGKHKGYRLLVE